MLISMDIASPQEGCMGTGAWGLVCIIWPFSSQRDVAEQVMIQQKDYQNQGCMGKNYTRKIYLPFCRGISLVQVKLPKLYKKLK